MKTRSNTPLASCLGLSGFFWGAVLLHEMRVPVAYSFAHGLFKALGPALHLFLLGGPLLSVVLGIRALRADRTRRLGWCGVVSGGLLTGLFVALVGVSAMRNAAAIFTEPRPLPPQASVPVFPGAEGFGTRTPAGRGGKVLFVTSLADSGPGSLREALHQPFPRTILFRVGGIIELNHSLSILHPFVTVAGQTAPGDGILIKNAGLNVMTHDVLIQHLRIRPGVEGTDNPENNDALGILNSRRGEDDVYNVVVDHCSFSWSEDETVSTWYSPRDITISWCFITEALNRARHPKRTHSAGLLIGDGSDRVSVHHNFLAHNDFRNPLLSGGGTHDFVNNGIYNWGSIACEIYDSHPAGMLVNFVGNHYVPGPATRSESREIILSPKDDGGSPKLYLEDNLGPHRSTSKEDEWALAGLGWGSQSAPARFREDTPFPTAPISRSPAAGNLEKLLAHAGATLPRRDDVDRRIISEYRSHTGRIPDAPVDVGGYPILRGGKPPVDGDQDGIPDDWESQKGLDPHEASDADEDQDDSGYTNLERYLHSLLAPDREATQSRP